MINNFRIQTQQTLISPEALIRKIPLSAPVASHVAQVREQIHHIISGKDHRLLVIVGPCSIHDTTSALEYATRLRTAAARYENELLIIMRTYFEKPRTTLGWKGLISDPVLDGSFDINLGLHVARKLLVEINQLGLPTATEFLDALIPQYLSDLIAWCAVGARTSESQIHRELASGLSMPVGFKNSTDGNIQVAIDAAQVAAKQHSFVSINQQGIPSVMHTLGNPFCHVVLRGSNTGSNFARHHVQATVKILQDAKLNPRLMIDCSHGNSMKNHSLQRDVVHSITEQLSQPMHGILGVMLESNLISGKQTLGMNTALEYGQSITDSCIGWEETELLLEMLASSRHC